MPSHERSSYLPSIIRESLRSISRNKLIAVAAVLSIIAALLILGIFLIFLANITQLTEMAENNSEIKIFLKEGVTQEQRENFYEILEDDPQISEITYESKEQALENFAESLNEYSELLSEYTEQDNPLPDSYIVKAHNIDDLANIKDKAYEYPEIVEYVRYQESYISSITSFSNFIYYVSIGLVIIMSVIAFFLIYNTIRLTVASRNKEIGIMKSIGATDQFIQVPFILEGTFLGLISALLSVLLICLVYYYVIGYLSGSFFIALNNEIVSPGRIIFLILISFIAYGVLIGSIGAAVATHKYLEV